MTTPVAIAARLGLPYHGNVASGVLVLPNGKAIDYPQPNGQGTIVVHGNNRPTITRTSAQTVLDTQNGNQWLDYAYLSGLNLQIGGKDLGSAPGEYYPPQRFLYSDSKHSWIGAWDCEVWVDVHIPPKIHIDIIKSFGVFGVFDATPTASVALWEDYLIPYEYWFDYALDFDSWFYAYQSAAGDKLLICRFAGDNGWQNYGTGIPGSQYYLAVYPYQYAVAPFPETPDTYYHRFLIPDTWALFTISGDGALSKTALGSGIQCSRTTWGYAELDTPEAWEETLYNDCILWTLTPEGDLDYYRLDFANHLTLRTCQIKNTRGLNLKISTDWEDGSHAGVKIVDGGCYLEVWEPGHTVPRRIHVQSGSLAPDNTGRSYDVMKDVWYPTGCVV